MALISNNVRDGFKIAAEAMIDPANGLHSMEWANADIKYRWTGRQNNSVFCEYVNRSKARNLYLNYLSLAGDIMPDYVKCFIDGGEIDLRATNNSEGACLQGIIPKSASCQCRIEIVSPLIEEPGGSRNLGIALKSIEVKG